MVPSCLSVVNGYLSFHPKIASKTAPDIKSRSFLYPDGILARNTWKKWQKYRRRRQLGVYWSVAEMQNGNPGNMNPTAPGNFQLRAGHSQLGWEYIKAGR